MVSTLGLGGMLNAGKRALLGLPPGEEKVTEGQAKASVAHHTTESVKSAAKSFSEITRMALFCNAEEDLQFLFSSLIQSRLIICFMVAIKKILRKIYLRRIIY